MLLIREPPPQRIDIGITAPGLRTYRWALDEPDPANSPTALTTASSMPGGWDQASITLPRDPRQSYADLTRLSKVQARTPLGVIYEGRLETAPRQSGDQMSVTVGLAGPQANLTDQQNAQAIYVSQDPSQWVDAPLNEQIYLASLGASQGDFSWSSQNGGLICQLPNQDLGPSTVAEIWFICPAGINVARIMYIGQDTSIPAGWESPELISAPSDTTSGATTDAMTLDNTLRSLTVGTPQRRVLVRVNSNGDEETVASGAQRVITAIAVYGDTGIPTQAIDSTTPDGVLATDAIKHAISTWCPLLSYDDLSIEDSTFVIPQLAFTTIPNTAADIIKTAVQYELLDWAVWEGGKVYVNPRGERGKEWRARVAPAQLQETGPQVANLYNQVVIQYADVDGTVRTVGPPGSGCDTEDASLVDADPENPVNVAGETRVFVGQMGAAKPDAAIQVGGKYLQAQKQLDTSGSASFVGYVEDASGVTWPASHVRAGDTVSFVDASDTSPRRIVAPSYDHSTKTTQVQLDQPPDQMSALLQELSLEISPFGLT